MFIVRGKHFAEIICKPYTTESYIISLTFANVNTDALYNCKILVNRNMLFIDITNLV